MFLVSVEIWNNRYQGCYPLFILISLLSPKTSCESVIRFLRYQANRPVTVLALISWCCSWLSGMAMAFVLFHFCLILLVVNESCHLHSA